MHRAFYTSRQDAGAVVHLHSTMATAVACLPDLDPIEPDSATDAVFRHARRATHADRPYYRPGNPQMEAAINNAARVARAVLLANHGAVACGKTLTDAVYAAEELEEAAKLFIMLRGGTRDYSPQRRSTIWWRHSVESRKKTVPSSLSDQRFEVEACGYFSAFRLTLGCWRAGRD